MGSNIKLIDDFIQYLFSRTVARKHKKLINETEYPGIISTKGTITYSQSDVVVQINNV